MQNSVSCFPNRNIMIFLQSINTQTYHILMTELTKCIYFQMVLFSQNINISMFGLCEQKLWQKKFAVVLNLRYIYVMVRYFTRKCYQTCVFYSCVYCICIKYWRPSCLLLTLNECLYKCSTCWFISKSQTLLLIFENFPVYLLKVVQIYKSKDVVLHLLKFNKSYGNVKTI